MDSSLDQALQEGKLLRHIDALIVAHLRDHNHHHVGLSFHLQMFPPCGLSWFWRRGAFISLPQAAASVASATMTPLNGAEALPNRLIDLVAKVFILFFFTVIVIILFII